MAIDVEILAQQEILLLGWADCGAVLAPARLWCWSYGAQLNLGISKSNTLNWPDDHDLFYILEVID